MELCSMVSHGCLPGPGFMSHPEPGSCRASEEFHHFLPYHGLNQDSVDPLSFNLKVLQKEDLRFTGELLNYNHCIKIDSTSKRHRHIDFQDAHPGSVHFSFGIAEQCIRHEKIMKLLTSGSIEEQDSLLNLAMLYDLMGPQSLITDFSQQPSASPSSALHDLLYPTRELYLNEPFLELENTYCPNGQLQYSCTGNEMNDMLSVISNFHSSKHTNRSSKQTMLVPYFERGDFKRSSIPLHRRGFSNLALEYEPIPPGESHHVFISFGRRRRARGTTDVSRPPTEKVGFPNSLNVKQQTPQKRKMSTKTGKKRDIYSNSYLHACESLLSIIANKEHQAKNTIISLKKSCPQLPELLVQFSATIAGAGIAVILSIFCRVVCSRVPFCESKLLSTGLGLGLVWLSRAVYKLRDTVISISKSCGNFGEREDEMMKDLGRNLKDIYLRVAALMVVVVLKVA